jgi:Adenosylmethionine-8-amino-7-oxononanoate aminotransferase
LSATLATEKIYETFLSDTDEAAFMHGPTFMGNPLACRVALKSIELFLDNNYLEKISRIQAILEEELLSFRTSAIAHTRVMGAVGVIEVKDSKDLIGISEFCLENGVWCRPFRNVVYTMPAYIISEQNCRRITEVMKKWFLQKERV